MLLVTGATGFLGRAVMRRLAPDGNAVRVLARSRRRVPAEWAAEIVEGDVLDEAAVGRAVSGCRAVVHLAAVTHAAHPAAYDAVNVEGTRVLVEAACREGIARFVLASTWVADARGGAYAASKRRAELLALQGMREPVVVRLSDLYDGEGGRGMRQLADWMRRHRWVPVIGTGCYALAPLHVDDAAEAMLSAWRTGAPGSIYTITGPETLTYNALVDRLAGALGAHPIKVRVPVWMAKAGVRWRRGAEGPAFDQIDRLLAPRSLMDSDAPRQLGLRLRRWSGEMPLTREAG